jgi:antitoxin ParD1/3/4
MPTRNISLTKHFDTFVDETVREGSYQNASEVVRDALRLLESKRREEELKLKRLRDAAVEGFADIERGNYTEIASKADLRKFMTATSREATKTRATKRRK